MASRILSHSIPWLFKGIVSRDWAGLQIIVLDRSAGFNVVFFMPSSAVLHFNINDQYSSGDSNWLVRHPTVRKKICRNSMCRGLSDLGGQCFFFEQVMAGEC